MGLFNKIGSKLKRGFQRIGSKKTGRSLSRIGSKISHAYKGARKVAKALDPVVGTVATLAGYGGQYAQARKALGRGDKAQRIVGRVGKSGGKAIKAAKRGKLRSAVRHVSRGARQAQSLQNV